MPSSSRSSANTPAIRRLTALALHGSQRKLETDQDLIAAGLAEPGPRDTTAITSAGRAHLARHAHSRAGTPIDPFRAQHLALTSGAGDQATPVLLDEAESPLLWLARRKGRDGRALIDPVQLMAGERLRQDFTRGALTPRVTASWSNPTSERNGAGDGNITDMVISARQRVRHALEAAGPEFSGLLTDVCCFLKRLEDVERERAWPARSGKVVLQLGLDRLARHYGLSREVRGRGKTGVTTWLAPDTAFTVEHPEP